ncbi:TIR domain-containing protein [Gallibacterium melopsittaci]|uniref:TIR domain-containing protein n=1 Tax=Gallibacterium melopsittaci TaxID=516063 RepID=A0ABV6HXU5_9PAST|nr:hypothetical protein [Gallibacterium salpingitidis]WKS98644.1 hypothetical protein NYR30_07580 [Gallibacterium salpingitidis]
MLNKTKNYSAFYVAEPFNESNLGAHATKDFCYYNMLRAWKGKDNTFSFINAHDATYSVRDGSDWERTLKPRLHERLKVSKNIILFLSKNTRNSRALTEEIEYGIRTLGLPVIVIYPDYKEKNDLLSGNGNLRQEIKDLWNKLPSFDKLMHNVPTLHIPMNKKIIYKALSITDFTIQFKNKIENGVYYYK